MQERDGIEIKAYQTSNRNEFSPMMDEQMTFTKQCDVAGDIIYLNPLILIPEKESPFASAERRLPVEFPYKQSETINTVITLPNGYTVEDIPKPIALKFDGINVRIVSNMNGNQLSTQFKLNIDKILFPATEYKDLKAFFDRFQHFRQKSRAVLKIGVQYAHKLRRRGPQPGEHGGLFGAEIV